jgi:hypothetical protein
VKAASDLMAPLSGKVVEVNAAVVDNVGLVNTKAESDGSSSAQHSTAHVHVHSRISPIQIHVHHVRLW